MSVRKCGGKCQMSVGGVGERCWMIVGRGGG